MRQTTLRREGDERLSARNDSASRPAKDPEKKDRNPRGPRGAASGDLGKALKTVYDETVREDIPDDFLDLLGKLS